jgi:hypothetical protein
MDGFKDSHFPPSSQAFIGRAGTQLLENELLNVNKKEGLVNPNSNHFCNLDSGMLLRF